MLLLEFTIEIGIGGDRRRGTAHHEGDLVIGVTLVGENHNTCKSRDIVLNRAKCVVELPGDLIGLVTQKEEAHGLNAMGLAGPDILLLPTSGHFNFAAAQGLDIADDDSNSAIEETKRQIFMADQATLVASFRREAENTAATQAFDTACHANLKILLTGIESQ